MAIDSSVQNMSWAREGRARGIAQGKKGGRAGGLTLRSVKATGCTEVAFMMPRKTMTRYKDPRMLFRSCKVPLQRQTIRISQN